MKQHGFTLIEIMISLFIGGLILGGVMFLYVGMKSTTKDTMVIGELQESGRLALSIMKRDIEQIGFWGTFYEDGFTDDNTVTLPNPTSDCFSGQNNGSFPDNSNTNFRSVFAVEATSALQLSCIKNANFDPVSDILQVKYLEGRQVQPDDSTNKQYYFIAQQEKAEFRRGPIDKNSINGNASVWPYGHHVYYVANQTYEINKQSISVPVLMRKRLTPSGGMITETVMEGVENMRFVFGLDTTSNNRVDTYKSIKNMTASDWENRQGILTVQVFILVRSLLPDYGLKLKSQVYTMGEDADQRIISKSDHFRRTLFTTTIRLNNVGANLWNI
ncbi:pilus assembly protein PilW [Pseudoalteromonas porphyrae]|uniref:Pilus assembly protein PilW n=1 Tax=Pseudoalteromonas porphyrae TaxID=187330 RepID=A0A0N1ELW2_9GAMM|nr:MULTISPECIES: PilW family protein [Pseudoalteromonas]KPH64717.1 pilus assembly protein PilW [Pseudoalteromonas porphyrae]KPH94575.1 pilus assembly protein PilW [Pseudoalteromonas porphyrae]